MSRNTAPVAEYQDDPPVEPTTYPDQARKWYLQSVQATSDIGAENFGH
jgi:hypothetical protein